MYVAGCMEVEVKSAEEAFQVFWRGKSWCKGFRNKCPVVNVDISALMIVNETTQYF